MTTCADILTSLQSTADDQAALYADSAAAVQPLLDLAGSDPIWVEIGGEDLPSIGELVNRIHALGLGLSQWRYQEQIGGRTVVTLPETCTPSRTRVWLNGVALGPDEITIGSTIITLDSALEIGDLLTVRTYG